PGSGRDPNATAAATTVAATAVSTANWVRVETGLIDEYRWLRDVTTRAPSAARPAVSARRRPSRPSEPSAAAAATVKSAAPRADSSGSLPLIHAGLSRNASPETARPPASPAQNA